MNATADLKIPHLLKQVYPVHPDPHYVCLTSRWSTTTNIEEAFVFPSEVLARRYAVMWLVQSGLSLLPVPTEGRASDVPKHHAACRGCGCTELFACPSRCHWAETDLCSDCKKGSQQWQVSWVVYRPTREFPNDFVARKHLTGTPTTEIVQASTLEELRTRFQGEMFALERNPNDAPEIVEVWL